MDTELGNWLKRLDVIEDSLAELISGVDLWVVLTLRDRDSGRPELADGGPVVLVWQSLVPKYVSPDDGAVWFDVGRDARPAVARWDADDGLSLHDSLPKECLAEMDGQEFCGETGLWGAQYLLRGGDEQKAAAHERVADRLFCVEEEALLACASAPQGVLDTVGDLSLFGNWPTAIFYLAVKGVHPMLTAEGQLQLVGPPVTIQKKNTDINPRPSRQSKDLGIALSVDLWTATRYAFEAFRQMVGDAVVEGTPEGDIPDEDGFVKNPSDKTAYWPVTEVIAISAPNLDSQKMNKLLKEHSGIRRWRPGQRKNRCNVHLGDWLTFLKTQPGRGGTHGHDNSPPPERPDKWECKGCGGVFLEDAISSGVCPTCHSLDFSYLP